MKQLYIRIREDQDTFLRQLPGSITENVRRAIDDYFIKITVASVSASKSKRGGNNE